MPSPSLPHARAANGRLHNALIAIGNSGDGCLQVTQATTWAIQRLAQASPS